MVIKNIVKEKQKEVNLIMEEARDKIEDTDWFGPFGHNVIGMVLASVAEKAGTEYANKLIDEYDFEEELGIMKVAV